MEQNEDAGSHLRGGRSSVCPLPVGKEMTKGFAAGELEDLAPLQPSACPFYGLVPGVEPGKSMKLYLFGNYLDRNCSLTTLNEPLKQWSRETGQNGTPTSPGC